MPRSTTESTEVVVVGAGQAGIAMSEHLHTHGIAHLVLERDRVAESWRSARWDSLVTNGPVWHDRFPSKGFRDVPPDDFATKDQVADYLVEHARTIAAPVRTGVEVRKVRRATGGPGFQVETSQGAIDARFVVAATGAFQAPSIPPLVPHTVGVTQLHSSQYRNAGSLPDGGVLVIGAGSSGVQIADELARAGRQVHLAVGPHDRPPRRYRGRDFVWWLGVLGMWDAISPPTGADHVTIAVSGARGGHTVDFRELARSGVQLVGRAESYEAGVLRFAPDLNRNIRDGDSNYLALLDAADAFVARSGLDLPDEPSARRLGPDPACMTEPILALDLAQAGITSIVWATGFAADYSWLGGDAIDEHGRPRHRRGISSEPGIYFLGLPWQSRRGSSFLWGVWHDAKFVGDQIAIQRAYAAYQPASGSADATRAVRCSSATHATVP